MSSLTTQLLALSAHPDAVIEDALALLREQLRGDCAVIALATHGQWTTVSCSGATKLLPEELLSETLDQRQVMANAHWLAAPLGRDAQAMEILAVRTPQQDRDLFTSTASVVADVFHIFQRREHFQRRSRRLEAILEIAGQWNQNMRMDSLLTQMAETSTRLMACDRASIFLWDKRNKTLVGRPALGIEGGELRIPDDEGIVGQVVQTGELRRLDAHENRNEINRDVDAQTGYQTNTLLCCPLRGKSGALFGAFEMINKHNGNFTAEDEAALIELSQHAAIALENTQEHEQLLTARQRIADEAAQSVQLIGQCDSIGRVRDTVRRIADKDIAVLILGENGTGKEVVSQSIHFLSQRRSHPFVAVNCAAIPENLLESELFGHEKGAFTDARDTRIGKFELADGGTLFLDEIGDMSLGGQAKMLRVLEEKVVVRVGGSLTIPTDARVIDATNQNLAQLVQRGQFREDLYFRLNVVTLELPPLRDRGDDILTLAEHFLRQFCLQARRKLPTFTAAAKKRLLTHAWPGNVREIRNLMERLAYLTEGDQLDAADLAFVPSPTSAEWTVFDTRLPLKRQLKRTRGNVTDAAELLGVHRSNLYRKMRQLGMNPDEVERE